MANKSGHLYATIARLRQQICDIEEEHRTELSTWTRKCGQMGNDIGNLRKQLAEKESEMRTEHQAALSLWTRKCGELGNEIGRIRKQLAEKESVLEAEHKATLHSWSKKCGEVVREIVGLRKEMVNKEIEYQIERDHFKQEVDVLRQHLEKMEIERQTDILKQRIESDLKQLIDRDADNVKDATVESQCDSGQINDTEADQIVKTYCSSEGETDEANLVHEAVGYENPSACITENLHPLVTEQELHPDEVVKQKPKFVFWATLKRHVSMKSKLAKSSTLTYKVSGTD